MQRPKHLIFTLVLLPIFLNFSCSKPYLTENTGLYSAQKEVWYEPAQTSDIINGIDTAGLSARDRLIWETLREHTSIRTNHQLPADTMMSTVISKMQSDKTMRSYLGYAHYVHALEFELSKLPEQEMKSLKTAETLLAQSDSLHELKGTVYYKLGMTSESDMLYNIALEYYNLALNELQQTNLYLFLACTLRDIGRTTNDSTSDRSIKCHYFDQALHYARLHGDTAIYLNILSYKLRYQPGDNEAEINKVNRHLCRELNYSRAASELCESFLSSETPDIDSALFYLKIFANDTSALAWSRDKYHLLDSRIKNLQGQNNIAYNELLKLYNSQTRQLAQDGKARTYTIARKYDLLLEHEKALERQIKLQHSYLVISLLVIALLIGGVLISVIILRNKEKERKNKQRIESLQSEVTHKRELLKNTLEQRLQLTKDLQNAELIEHKKRGEVPLWAKKFIEESLFSQQNQEDFLLQFNIISDNFLNHLQEEYPALTKVDTQIIALIITGLSISDICLLLNQTKNTIWSRRLRIKSHLNLTADDNLDEWLLNKYATSV